MLLSLSSASALSESFHSDALLWCSAPFYGHPLPASFSESARGQWQMKHGCSSDSFPLRSALPHALAWAPSLSKVVLNWHAPPSPFPSSSAHFTSIFCALLQPYPLPLSCPKPKLPQAQREPTSLFSSLPLEVFLLNLSGSLWAFEASPWLCPALSSGYLPSLSLFLEPAESTALLLSPFSLASLSPALSSLFQLRSLVTVAEFELNPVFLAVAPFDLLKTVPSKWVQLFRSKQHCRSSSGLLAPS